MQSTTKLNKYEIKFYILVCIVSCLVCIYQVFIAGDYLTGYGQGFIEGWKWLGRKRDNYDRQWRIRTQSIRTATPWILLQVIISQFMKHAKVHKTIICCWYIVITGAFLWKYYGIGGMVYLLIPPCTACLLLILRCKFLVYVAYVIILGVSRHPLISDLTYFLVNVDAAKYYLLITAFSWLHLKGINCCVDNIDNDKHKTILELLGDMIQCVAYCWYLPTLFLGPHILFHNFSRSFDEPLERWSFSRMAFHLLNLLRFTFWLFVNEIMRHYLYITALMYHPHRVAKLGAWAFYGLGYCMRQHFCNKYIILYGINSEMSRMDDIESPPPPKCVSRMHSCSDICRHFDRGLYEFLMRCIYVPIRSINIPLGQLFACMITFSFVYMWHGVHRFVLVWVVLNFTGLILESIGNAVGSSRIYRKWRDKSLSPQTIRRLTCAFSTPLLAMSAIANIYFVGGVRIGYIFLRRLLSDPPMNVFIVLFVMYCGYQISVEVKLNELREMEKNQHQESVVKKTH